MSYKTEEQRYWEDIRRKGVYFFGACCFLIAWLSVFIGIYGIWADANIGKFALIMFLLFCFSMINICFLEAIG